MKTLIDYIVEKKETIQSLPFDSDFFEEFIQVCIIDAEYDSAPIWDEMEKIVIGAYNKSVWRWFQGWCEGYLAVQDSLTIKEFYDSLLQFPKERINRILGSGSNGIVIDMGDRVMKIYYGDKIKFCDAPLV